MDTTVVELCQEAYKNEDFAELARQYIDINTFYCILLMENRTTLLRMFDALHDQHEHILTELQISFFANYLNDDEVVDERALRICIEVGEFLIQYGLFQDAINFLCVYEDLLYDRFDQVSLGLEFYQKLLYLDAILYQFEHRTRILYIELDNDIVSDYDFKIRRLLKTYEEQFETREAMQLTINLASVYSNYSVLHFTMCKYDLAYKYALLSIKHLRQDEDTNIVIQVLRQASKACTVNHFFVNGKYLIVQAIGRAIQTYSDLDKNPKYAEVLIDYAFFLGKFGKFKESKEKYEEALTIYKNIFGQKNLHIVMAEIDLVEVLIEGKLYDGSTIRLIEDVIQYIGEEISRNDDTKNTILIKATIVKARLLLSMLRSKGPKVRNRKLKHIKVSLKSIERIIVDHYGPTSSLYTKHLIILTDIYFSIKNYEEAFTKSKCILGRVSGYFSYGRDLHEPIVRAKMACAIIDWCDVVEYRDEVIKATRTLERSVVLISINVENDLCRELEHFYRTLKTAHQKITNSNSTDFKNNYHIYETKLIEWQQYYVDNYPENFYRINGAINSTEEIVNLCEHWKQTL